MYNFISREFSYRYSTCKDMHWFKGNIQKTFEILLGYIICQLTPVVLIAGFHTGFTLQ